MTARYLTFLFFIVSLFWACSGGTKITDSWSDQAVTPAKFKKMCVVGVGRVAENRKLMELTFEEKLDARGVNAIGALDFLPPNATKDNISKEVFFRFLDVEKFDAVMIISVMARDREVSSTMSVSAAGWVPQYNVPFNDYYGRMAAYAYAPVHVTTTDIFYLECALYSYPEGKMIWAAQSKTVPLYNLEQTIYQYSDRIIKDMTKRKVLVEFN
jgi:hypothetical protein